MTSPLAARLLDRYYDNSAHPYRVFERQVASLIGPETRVLLDAGCGRTVPVLRQYLGRVDRLIGVEMVEFTDVPPGIEVLNADLANIPLPDASVDLVMSRSVFEHLTDPTAVYAEMSRLLTPGGRIVFLTANYWDYGTQVARLVPNRFHARVVRAVEGRPEEDTFPTAYKTNTRSDVLRLARGAGLEVERIDYLSQYPNYLMFNGLLFGLGVAYERLVSRFEALKFLRGWIQVVLVKPAR
jgi:SAM-dependent methyltransferase